MKKLLVVAMKRAGAYDTSAVTLAQPRGLHGGFSSRAIAEKHAKVVVSQYRVKPKPKPA